MSLEDAGRTALRARAHPLRLRMLSLLTGAPMSAAELGRELGISQALASYHLRFLVEAGAVELAEEVVNRGGKERRYRHHAGQPTPASAALGTDDQELLVTAVVEELRRRHPERIADGRSLMIDAELWVTPEEWVTFRDAVRDASVRLHDSAVRPHQPGTTRVSATAVMFEMHETAESSS
jgi:DNA-binding transcriptional ArsR family regulator